jgi:hypothetical protein
MISKWQDALNSYAKGSSLISAIASDRMPFHVVIW